MRTHAVYFLEQCPGCGGKPAPQAVTCAACWQKLDPWLRLWVYSAYEPRSGNNPQPKRTRAWKLALAHLIAHLQQMELFPQLAAARPRAAVPRPRRRRPPSHDTPARDSGPLYPAGSAPAPARRDVVQ